MALEPILRVGGIRAIEAANGAAPLMERAGLAAASIARDLLRSARRACWCSPGPATTAATPSSSRAAARGLFFDVTVVFRGDASRLPADARDAHRAFIGAGGATVADIAGPDGADR